jgi:hypothetical protein
MRSERSEFKTLWIFKRKPTKGQDQNMRMEWPMGRLTRVFPERDSNIRVVTVKTVSAGLVRPVQHVQPWRYAFVCLVGQKQYSQHFHNALYTHVSGVAA